MTKISKRYKKASEGLTSESSFDLKEAVKLLKEKATAKFDETVDIAMNLGVDPKHSDQMVRGAVSMPKGTGKTARIAVFAKDKKAEEAKSAGADIVGAEDLAEKVEKVATLGFGNLPSTLTAISATSGPETLTTPIPPFPAGVAIAAIVSLLP